MKGKVIAIETGQGRAYRRLQAQTLLDAFEASTGRAAKTIEELESWVASEVGQAVLAVHKDPSGKVKPKPRPYRPER